MPILRQIIYIGCKGSNCYHTNNYTYSTEHRGIIPQWVFTPDENNTLEHGACLYLYNSSYNDYICDYDLMLDISDKNELLNNFNNTTHMVREFGCFMARFKTPYGVPIHHRPIKDIKRYNDLFLSPQGGCLYLIPTYATQEQTDLIEDYLYYNGKKYKN